MTIFHLHLDGRIENGAGINLDVSSGFAIYYRKIASCSKQFFFINHYKRTLNSTFLMKNVMLNEKELVNFSKAPIC